MPSSCAGHHGREIRRLFCVISTSAEASQVRFPSLNSCSPGRVSRICLCPLHQQHFGRCLYVVYHNVTQQLSQDACHLMKRAYSHGVLCDSCHAVPFDLVLNLRRLKQIIKKSTVEEEREVIEKALRKSEMLEVSKDGQLIHNKDIKSERASIVLVTALDLSCCLPASRACQPLADDRLMVWTDRALTAWKSSAESSCFSRMHLSMISMPGSKWMHVVGL